MLKIDGFLGKLSWFWGEGTIFGDAIGFDDLNISDKSLTMSIVLLSSLPMVCAKSSSIENRWKVKIQQFLKFPQILKKLWLGNFIHEPKKHNLRIIFQARSL